jgi:putative ABC transport system substrate-binding protein
MVARATIGARARVLATVVGISVPTLSAEFASARPAVVGASNVPAFRDALEGAQSELPDAAEYDLVGSAPETIRQRLDADHPDVIVAVGPTALQTALATAGKALVVYAMVADPEAILNKSPKEHPLAGVSLQASPVAQLTELRRVVPSVCQLWTVYSPQESGRPVEQLRRVAAAKGCGLVATEVHDIAEALRALQSLPARFDAYVMLPDRVVRNATANRVVVRLGCDRRVPVVGVSANDVRAGALLALQLDPRSLGRQAARLARKAAATPARGSPEMVVPEGYKRVLNLATAQRLGVNLSEEVRRGAEVIGP